VTKANKIAALVAAGILAVATAVTVIVLVTSNSKPVVTRDDVLTQWAKMPLHPNAASPADVDREADRVCAKIRQDNSAKSIIANAEQLDRSNGGGNVFREYLHLMVGYRCSEYADEFE
jgi:hypothetical protein